MLAASVVGLLVASSIALIAGPAQATTAGFTAANGIVYGPSAGDGTITAIGYTGSDTTVVIPATVLKDSMTYPVTAIGEYAFMGKDLSSIILSDGLIKIDSYAFGQNPMTAITIPASVTYIGQDIFYDGVVVSVTFAGLAPTTLDDSNASYPPLGWGLRNEGVTVTPVTVHYLSQFGATGGFTTPTWMGYNTVIDPIVSFESNGHGTIGAQRLIAGQLAVAPTFTGEEVGCWTSDAALTTKFNFSVAPTDDVILYAKWTPCTAFTTANGITYDTSAGDGTATAVSLTDAASRIVEIPDTVEDMDTTYRVTAIGDRAFAYKSLTAVTIGRNVTTIGFAAFQSNLLTSISIPASVTTIGGSAFHTNSFLTLLDIPGSVENIGDAAFANTGLTSVTLHEGLESIGGYAFANIAGLTAITMPASMQSIGANIFYRTPVVSVTFAGAAPTLFADNLEPSLGNAEGLTVHYLSQFAVDGGFTSGAWTDYLTVIDPIVSFESNGHGTIGAQRLIAGQLAVDPVPTDADFDGWFTTADFTTEFDFSVAPTDDVTVYAKWPLAVVVEPEAPSSPTLTLNLGLAVGDTVAGALVAVSGAGLKEGSSYTIILRSTPVLLAGGTIDSSGAFTASANLPTGLSAGQHTVTLTGTAADSSIVSRVAFLTVSATGTVTYLSYTAADAVLSVTATSTTTALASTGFTAAPLGFAALLLLLAGAALVAARRRSIA
ncbi:leucine-rich repeat protein [Cryobacterium sp. Hh11]|uniref:leucine-rich repeat protein n=1 Tax=Cryobacterium sp. Hh11 TaxID=2555868 RepID=UPI00141A8A0E|nr:leucine-rich repeat protein [Cryobacterium sp. Hh11]